MTNREDDDCGHPLSAEFFSHDSYIFLRTEFLDVNRIQDKRNCDRCSTFIQTIFIVVLSKVLYQVCC